MSEYAEAAAVQVEALELSRTKGLADEANYGVYSLGMIAYRTDDLEEAQARLRESLDGWRDSGHHVAVASVLGTLGEVIRLSGDLVVASACFSEAIDVAQRVDARALGAAARAGLGRVATDLGDWEGAAAHLSDAATLLRRDGAREDLVRLVESCAALAGAKGDSKLAFVLLEASIAERKRSGALRAPVTERKLAGVRDAAVADMSPAEVVAAESRGRSMTLDAALELALGRPT